MNQLFWNIFCFLLWVTQALRVFRYFKRTKSIILCYGGIIETRNKSLLWNADGRYLNKKAFDRQIRYLRNHYRLVSPAEIAENLENRKTLPFMSLAITFDYGYSCTFLNALTSLSDDNIPYGLSFVTDFIENRNLIWHDRLELAISRSRNRDLKVKIGGYIVDEKIQTPKQKVRAYLLLKGIAGTLDVRKRNMLLDEIENQLQFSSNENVEVPDNFFGMTTSQIKETTDSGVEIGSQSTHLVDLSRVSRQDLIMEIYESKSKIEDIAGKKCSYFVYPQLKKVLPDESIAEIVDKSGYSYALTNIPNLIQSGINPYSLPRITISGKDSFFTFAAKLAGIGIKRNLF